MQSDFDKEFRRMGVITAISAVGGVCITIGTLVFIGWVIVKLMQFYGVV